MLPFAALIGISSEMKTTLVISSFVAASRVGASASAFCLRRLGIETVTLPTTLLGRHPGWGRPGGGPVPLETLESMWVGIKGQDIQFDAVLTGYMASQSQINLAARIIKHVKHSNPDALIIVDPVMGDHGKLYVDEAIAQAIKTHLLPLADLITPNVWELGYLTGLPVKSQTEIFRAARNAHAGTIVTSVPDSDQIGAAFICGNQAALVSHQRFTTIPHGGGDALAGTLLAHRLLGLSPEDALAKAVASIFEIISNANDEDAGELPLIRRQDALATATPLCIQELRL